MNNHQVDNIQTLINKEAKIEEILFDEDKRPQPKEIVQFLESIHELAESTKNSDEFVRALKLFQKWKVNLFSFYDINYRKRISRSAYDFSLAARMPKGKEVAPWTMILRQFKKDIRTGDVNSRKQPKDNFHAISQKDKDTLNQWRSTISH